MSKNSNYLIKNNDLVTDLKDLNYDKFSNNIKSPETINNPFYDTIILIFILDISDTYIKKHRCINNNKFLELKEIINNLFYPNNIIIKSQNNYELTEKLILKNLKNDEIKIRDIIKKNNISNPIACNLKITSHNIEKTEIDNVLNKVKNDNNILIGSLDITKDVSGFAYNDYLKYFFVKNLSNYSNENDINKENYKGKKIILNKPRASKLTTTILYGNTRFKIYNKTHSQYTNTPNNKSCGNLLSQEFIKTSNKRYNNLVNNPLYKSDGCTRLEITIYPVNLCKDFHIEKKLNIDYDLKEHKYFDIFNEDDVNEILDFQNEFTDYDYDIFYKCSQKESFEHLISYIDKHTIIFDKLNKKYIIYNYYNSETNKFNSYEITINDSFVKKLLKIDNSIKKKIEEGVLNVKNDILDNIIKKLICSTYIMRYKKCYYVEINDINIKDYNIDIYKNNGPSYITEYNNLFTYTDKTCEIKDFKFFSGPKDIRELIKNPTCEKIEENIYFPLKICIKENIEENSIKEKIEENSINSKYLEDVKILNFEGRFNLIEFSFSNNDNNNIHLFIEDDKKNKHHIQCPEELKKNIVNFKNDSEINFICEVKKYYKLYYIKNEIILRFVSYFEDNDFKYFISNEKPTYLQIDLENKLKNIKKVKTISLNKLEKSKEYEILDILIDSYRKKEIIYIKFKNDDKIYNANYQFQNLYDKNNSKQFKIKTLNKFWDKKNHNEKELKIIF